ncbi:hypothetical protein HFO56_23865 [Rhizobium laguerreae]|uniref:hypothetical protein n=1 Tax=Rhizobium laguerreae TaxID=1076926 RepID=UPI001C9169F6|nr:hypothetical protein [Rhizobium laguerreae]MBY3155365.1 hypothetical protein [Rhizobium laguerreae]
MTTQRSTASEIQDIAKSINCLASRLQSARQVDPAHAVAIMSIIASRYRQAVETAPAPHLIAELPGNAALWKAMASTNGHVDENLYDRLKWTISRSIAALYPDIGRFAQGVDASLMAAAKFRRVHDDIDGEIQFAVDTGRAASHAAAPLSGLRNALLNGGVSARKLSRLALETIHDLVFSHTLSHEEGVDFVEYSMEDATDSFDRAVTSFGYEDRLASVLSTITANLDMFRARFTQAEARARHAA